MADIKFACPHCNQHITCDELWGGHELQCPGCQNNLVVPAPAGAAEPAAKSLVPAPPKGGAAKVAINRPQAHGTGAGAAAPNKAIPIRNLAPTVKKKQSPVVKIAIGAAVTVALGAGGYFGFMWVSDYQAKIKAKSAEADKSADGGQVGHIAEVNAVMDATDPAPASADSSASAPKRRKRAEGSQQTAAGGGDSTAGAAPAPVAADTQPVIPPAYTLDLAVARIPETRANGSLSGTNFLVEMARVDPTSTAQVLRLMQGPTNAPDREILVYLHLKPGEKLGGQTLAISQDMRGTGVPQVSKRWKTNPRFAPLLRSYSTGYVLKLELGQLADNSLPGKIYISFPDPEQSVVAGSFKATVLALDPNAQMLATPTPTQTPTTRSASQSAMDARYGIRR